MKFRLALATIAFSMLTAVAANAQVSVSITPPTGTSFTGVLDNTTASDITITEESLGWAPSSALNLTDTLGDAILANGGVTLAPSTPQSFTFTFDSNVDILTLAVKNADGTIVGLGSSVPEPGSVAMLIGTGMGGGLLLLRRRRK